MCVVGADVALTGEMAGDVRSFRAGKSELPHKAFEHLSLTGQLLAGGGAFFGGCGICLDDTGNLADSLGDLRDGTGLPFSGGSDFLYGCHNLFCAVYHQIQGFSGGIGNSRPLFDGLFGIFN